MTTSVSTKVTGKGIFSDPDRRYAVALLLLYLWMALGIFPLYNAFEGDSMRIAAGAATLSHQGFSIPPLLSYQYGMQPAIIYVIAFIHRCFPAMSTYAIYSLLSALAALALIPLCVELIHRLARVGRDVALLAVALLPESYAIATYPNSAIFAEVMALAAFLAIAKGARWWCYLPWLCVAPLFRIDIIIVYPVVLFLFRQQPQTWRRSLLMSVLTGVAVLVFIVGSYWLLQANPFTVLSRVDNATSSSGDTVLLILSIYTFYNVVNLLLAPAGAWLIAKRRDYTLLLTALVPTLLIHYMYRNNSFAAKHFLYILPFIALMTSQALSALISARRRRRWLVTALAVLLALYYVVSIRFDIPGKPWRNAPTSFSQQALHIPLAEENSTPYHLRLGIGGGIGVATADELMLLSGGLFYTDYLHRVKSRDAAHASAIHDFFSQTGEKDFALVTVNWSDIFLYPAMLLDEGYQYRQTAKKSFELRKDDRTIRVYSLETDHDEDRILRIVKAVKEKEENKDCPIYICSLADSYLHTLQQLCGKRLCSEMTHGVYKMSDIPTETTNQ